MRTLLMLTALCACMLLPTSGEAHHNTQHRVLVVGEWTSVQFQLPACWDVDAAAVLVLAARKSFESFENLYTLLNTVTVDVGGRRDIACGEAIGFVLPMWVIHRETARERSVTMFRFMLGNGISLVGLSWVPVLTQAEYLLSVSE